MAFALDPNSWELWAIAALLISIAEIFDGSGHVLAVGLAAAIMALIIGIAAALGIRLLPSLTVALLAFAALSVASVVIVRLVWKRGDQGPDINRY